MSIKLQNLPMELQFDRLIEHFENFQDLVKYCKTSKSIKKHCEDNISVIVRMLKKYGIDMNKLSINDFLLQYSTVKFNKDKHRLLHVSYDEYKEGMEPLIGEKLSLDKIAEVWAFYTDIYKETSLDLESVDAKSDYFHHKLFKTYTNLDNFVYLPNLQHLYLKGENICLPIGTFLPNLITLELYKTDVKEIPTYSTLQRLVCLDNEYLETINKQPNLFELICVESPKIKHISYCNDNTVVIINDVYESVLDKDYKIKKNHIINRENNPNVISSLVEGIEKKRIDLFDDYYKDMLRNIKQTYGGIYLVNHYTIYKYIFLISE
jgi:hypothetical protein